MNAVKVIDVRVVGLLEWQYTVRLQTANTVCEVNYTILRSLADT